VYSVGNSKRSAPSTGKSSNSSSSSSCADGFWGVCAALLSVVVAFVVGTAVVLAVVEDILGVCVYLCLNHYVLSSRFEWSLNNCDADGRLYL